MLQVIEGDLLNSDERVIAHGCNCQGVMGAGIAGQIAKRWSNVLGWNKDAIAQGWFVPGASQPVYVAPYGRGLPGPSWVFNLATQGFPGADAQVEWIYRSFLVMFEQCRKLGFDRVAIPRIGCGIGGLNWSEVECAIEDAQRRHADWRAHDVEVVVYDYTPGGK